MDTENTSIEPGSNETVEQVCELMTGWENHTWMSSADHKYIGELAKRILAAHKREIAVKDALIKALAEVLESPEEYYSKKYEEVIAKAREVLG